MADGSVARLTALSAGDRVPPHNLDAEQSLLGSMFLSAEAIEAVLMEVRPDDFYRPGHKTVYEAIAYLYNRGDRADVVTVADRLEATGQLEQVGGKPYLLTIVNTVPTAANVRQYAEIVRRLSTLRELIFAGTRIVGMSYERQDEPEEVVQEAERLVFDVANKRMQGNFRVLHELLKDGFKHLEALYESQEHVTGVPTGYPELDHILAGLHRGDLIILAARPSVGKTALALNIAVNAAKRDVPVAIFSLEMSSEQLVQRILCSEAEIDSHKMQTGTLTDLDWGEINYALGRLDKCELWVDDTPSSSILEVRSKARRLFTNRTQGLIVVDYLQLMQPAHRRSESRQVEIAEISRGLKILSKELQIPVLALSQLSRAVEQRAGKRPMLSDLRECVTGETLVVLTDGRRVPIRDLVGQTPRVLAVSDKGRVIEAQSDAVWEVGKREVYALRLASGRVVRATGRHRFLTGQGWRRLDEMKPGERVALAHEAVVDREVSWDALSAIQPDGEETVYDLTVPGPASWLADGIVSHNSGALEQDSDVVVFIDRVVDRKAVTEEDSDQRPNKGEAEIIVAKHRNGPTGSCKLAFKDRYTKFVPMATHEG